jgi:hypothetical protein
MLFVLQYEQNVNSKLKERPLEFLISRLIYTISRVRLAPSITRVFLFINIVNMLFLHDNNFLMFLCCSLSLSLSLFFTLTE